MAAASIYHGLASVPLKIAPVTRPAERQALADLPFALGGALSEASDSSLNKRVRYCSPAEATGRTRVRWLLGEGVALQGPGEGVGFVDGVLDAPRGDAVADAVDVDAAGV